MEMNNKAMTEAERLELAAKLDKDLDEFINKLPKRERKTGEPMDEAWIEELQSHPFFMKKVPEPGEKVHPLYEGLQKLKYDPDINEPLDLAVAYKDDGNFNFKHKNYRLAILSYTEGIKAKCDDVEINASLYNNRSAANFYLKNYRSSLRDCELALKLKPGYHKTLQRAANCCFCTQHFDKAIEYCDKILDADKNNKDVQELRKKCVTEAKLKIRNERKREKEIRKQEEDEKRVIQEIVKRGIRIETGKGGLSLSSLEPCAPQLSENRVHIDDENNLIWPVVFLYPEYKIMDYVQEFNENQTFEALFEDMFSVRPEWDVDNKYKTNSLVIYFETGNNKLTSVNRTATLVDVLKHKEYVVKGGTPSFLVLVNESPAHKRFLENY